MGYKSCHGYTRYTAKCSECDFEDDVTNISMRCAGAKFEYQDGDKCPEEDCQGVIKVSEEEVSEYQHREEYLDAHCDDEHDRDR